MLLRIQDALEAGDIAEVEAIVLSALEDGSSERRLCCDLCAWTGQWPGELFEHRRIAHWEAA